MRTLDPTREEMLAALDAFGFVDEQEEFDREEAIYWFANDWHGGQDSNLYSVLSTSAYSPGPIANGPSQDGIAMELYQHLQSTFGESA